LEIAYKINEHITITEEADTQAEAFKVISAIHEVFGVTECGACKSEVFPRVRVVEDNAYHEICCTNPKCRSVLAYGQNKKGGGLFPKRKDKDGNWLPNNGFVKYVPGQKNAE